MWCYISFSLTAIFAPAYDAFFNCGNTADEVHNVMLTQTMYVAIIDLSIANNGNMWDIMVPPYYNLFLK